MRLRQGVLELWGLDQDGEHLMTAIPRDSILNVDIAGGELTQSGGGFLGGGFGLTEAAVGIASAALLNALTTRSQREPVLLTLTTDVGIVSLATTTVTALELRGHLAPLLVDEQRNRGRASRL